MRDIRHDIRERLTEIEERRSRLQTELSAAEDESHLLMRLLDIEDERFPANAAQAPSQPEQTAGDFVIDQLRKRGSMTKDEVRDAMERAGYFAGGEAPGRSAHLTLVNLERSGRLRSDDSGRYHVSAEKTFTTAASGLFHTEARIGE